ncbi:PhzF family phenazine biosynthesis isomerase [Sansalvadorimonas sp. 2012CJ34-2]|uniref:PhzF family phenazine biosynthesis isomerase n=1 Tax=Parendozoicomonas callyspongiae TaxID=2942213 RepID=A0ABT0PIQ7_9GAMM|nr:PhzF family phenazine biosynthesis isomerase [Sansalvadorimonas sp. 2012CJ34-2]MCL6271208.1 PhzF family phenazine biosynthesis isomerase [Sansalvadorimonas sp. 2012CJ34-2]
MIRIKIFRLDTFTDTVFSGNPAMVCPLPEWLPEDVLQGIAAENNSETAFIVGGHSSYHIRWFTPVCESNLSAHATLAAAKVIRDELGDMSKTLTFKSLRGELTANFLDKRVELSLPIDYPFESKMPEELKQELGFTPVAAMLGQDDWLVVAPEESIVSGMNLVLLDNPACHTRGMVVTAASDTPGTDFVSRCFGGPGTGIIEDPLNASAHSLLTAYWSEKLDKNLLIAKSASHRGGEIECQLKHDRVLIRGEAKLYMDGELRVPGDYFAAENLYSDSVVHTRTY